MFNFKDSSNKDKVFNPLKVTKNCIIEFNIGELGSKGVYSFKKIVEISLGAKRYARYLIYSISEDTEHVFEVFPLGNEQTEAYLYSLEDTIPFSEEFLDVAGQKYLTTPEGDEFERTIMPEQEERIDGVSGRIKVYDLQADMIERELGIKLWDYQREIDGKTELLNVEMMEDTGMFRIFRGERIEDIFYTLYHGTEN